VGVKAEASVISIPNYIPPDSFKKMSKADQDAYIRLGQIKNDVSKKDVLDRKNTGKQIFVSNYTISGAKVVRET
jgi:hypothetical protein